MYEVDYDDRHRTAMSTHVIVENLFPQVDKEGQHHLPIYRIIDVRNDGNQIKDEDDFINSKNIVKKRKKIKYRVGSVWFWKNKSIN